MNFDWKRARYSKCTLMSVAKIVVIIDFRSSLTALVGRFLKTSSSGDCQFRVAASVTSALLFDGAHVARRQLVGEGGERPMKGTSLNWGERSSRGVGQTVPRR